MAFYSLSPSVTLTSQSPRAQFDLGYAFGWTHTAPNLDAKSHVLTFGLSRQLSPRSNIDVGSGFTQTSDARTFYALRGIAEAPDESGLQLFFYPVAVQQIARDYRGNINFSHKLSDKSGLSFGGGFSLREYPNEQTTELSDQQGGSASLSFSRRISSRTELTLGYSASYYTFHGYEDAFQNVLSAGFSSVIAKDTALNWSLGASHLQNPNAPGSDIVLTYQGSAGISREIKGNYFNLTVSQDGGGASGAGAMSKNRRIGLGFSRNLGHFVNIFADVSAFDSQGVLDNTLDIRGGSATANVGFIITERISLQVAGQYQRQSGHNPFAFSQKRLFASLRYSHPNLLRSR